MNSQHFEELYNDKKAKGAVFVDCEKVSFPAKQFQQDEMARKTRLTGGYASPGVYGRPRTKGSTDRKRSD